MNKKLVDTDNFIFEFDSGKMKIYAIDLLNAEKTLEVNKVISERVITEDGEGGYSAGLTTSSVGVGNWHDFAPSKEYKKSNGYPKDKKALSIDYVFNTEDYYEPSRKEIVAGSDEKENPLVTKSRTGKSKPYTTIHNR